MTNLNFLRSHRRRWRLSQTDLAHLLGYKTKGYVCRAERQTPTSLAFALGCQVVFGLPPHEIFPGLYRQVEEAVIGQGAELASRLGPPEGDDETAVKHQLLCWMIERSRPYEA